MAEAILAPPIVPQRRPRDEPEIIDVDLLDDDEIVITGYGRSLRRRLSQGPPEYSRAVATRTNNREVIVLSDDEDAVLSGPSRASGSRRRLVSPPPPPQARQLPPPVPSLPLRLMFPRSRSRAPQPAPPPPAIAPNPQPFAFEAHLHQPPPPRQPSPPIVLPPRGAPPSHHQPAMGLGGAILALNRQPRNPEASGSGQRQQGAETHRRTGYGFSDLHSWVSDLFEFRRRQAEPRHRADYQFWPLADLDFGHMDDGMASMDEILAQVREPKSTEVMWKQEYTHPGQSQPGYSNHFSEDLPPATSMPTPKLGSSSAQAIVIPDDDPEPVAAGPSFIKSESEPSSPLSSGFTLVCARCTDPLYLSDDDQIIPAEERKARRVWGLRCGHILDGKCIHNLMRPSVPTPDPISTFPERVPDPPPAPPAENSMRSRLRPRHSRADTAANVASSLTLGKTPSEDTVASLLSPSRRREAREARANPYAKGKGKGRARKPVVLEQFDWQCPVGGCGHVHRSIHLKGSEEDGGWSMDPERGAIAMFV